MKTYFKVLLCSLFIFFLYFPAGAEQSLRIAVDDDFPPFSFVKNGKAVGIDIDIVRELGKRLNINFKISLMPWKRLIIMTRKGAYDGSMSLFQTKEREEFAIFTHPIHYSTFVLFVKKGNEFNFTSVKDLYGKKVMRQAGFSISNTFEKAVEEKKIIVQEIFEFTDIFSPLFNGETDAFLGNLEVTLHKLRSQQEYKEYADQITYLPKPIETKRGAFFVLAKANKLKGKKELAQSITKNLIMMENDGTYSRITSKYINN